MVFLYLLKFEFICIVCMVGYIVVLYVLVIFEGLVVECVRYCVVVGGYDVLEIKICECYCWLVEFVVQVIMLVDGVIVYDNSWFVGLWIVVQFSGGGIIGCVCWFLWMLLFLMLCWSNRFEMV